MAFILQDNQIYNECLSITPGVAVNKGDISIQGDVAGLWMTDSDPADGETPTQPVFVYKMRQVTAPKRAGTGFAIVAGERLYYNVSLDAVEGSVIGVIGTDSYFIGWCKEGASASATTVLMEFDGTRYDQVA